MYKNIIIGLDLESEDDTPVHSGVALAEEYGAAARVVCAVRQSLLLARGFFNAELIDRKALIAEAKHALATRLPDKHSLTSSVFVGKASDELAAATEHFNADLIVIGAKPRSRSEALFGTTATNILRLAHGVDIYACHRPAFSPPISEILVAVDGRNHTENVLSHVRTLVDTTVTTKQPTVRIVCVDCKEAQRQFVSQLSSQIFGNALTPIFVEGNLVENLNKLIGEFYSDLLVIGSGANVGPTWFVGSTTNDVLHDAACDVLVIR